MKQFIEVTDLKKNRVFINVDNISHITDRDTGCDIHMVATPSYIQTKELYNDIAQKIKGLGNM